MKAKDKLIQQVVDGFQRLRGRASLYCYNKEVIPELVYTIIYYYNKKNPNKQIFIVVDCYETRQSLYNCFNKNNVCLESGYNIRILSGDFIKLQYHYNYDLIITVGLNKELTLITKLYDESRFTLSILTKNIMDNEFISKLRAILPSIDTGNIDQIIKQDNIYSPVEEHRYGIELSDDERELYDKYTDFITTSISIFGDLYNIEKCKKGDEKLGISAIEFRHNLAKENGWREDLDTNISFMKQIDEIYNPNILFERACTFYNIAKQRIDLVSDSNSKLEQIYNICKSNSDKKILIISKRGEYAAKITKYLNDRFITDNIKCGDYHDCIEDAIAVDDNGSPILVKSGKNKGKPKIIGAQFQSTSNEKRFNTGLINILSIKNASNPKLKIACDLVIITSSLCDNIVDIKTRFSNVGFGNIPTLVHKIFCNNTIEHEKMIKKKENNLITVINENEDYFMYNENSGEIVL